MTAIGDYKIGKKLGQGAAGAVYRAVHTSSGDHCAIKLFNPEFTGEWQRALVDREFEFGQRAGTISKYALKYKEMFRGIVPSGPKFDKKWRGKETVFIVTEFIPGYSIQQYLQCCEDTTWRIEPAEWVKFMSWILTSVDHIHTGGIVHGDLNDGNIYFSTAKNTLFLIDFGGSCDLNLPPKMKAKSDYSAKYCAYDLTFTPDYYMFPAIAKGKKMLSWNQPDYTDAELRHHFRLHDLYSVLAVGLSLLAPDIQKTIGKRAGTKQWKQKGLSSVSDLYIGDYEKVTGWDIPAIKEYVKSTFERLEQVDSSITARSMKRDISAAMSAYSEYDSSGESDAPTSLQSEFNNTVLARKLLAVMKSFAKNAKAEYELRNIMERFLLTCVNTTEFPLILSDAITSNDKAFSKLRSELDEKKKFVKASSAKIVHAINAAIASYTDDDGAIAVCGADGRGRGVVTFTTVRNQIKIPITPRIADLIEIHDPSEMLLRYETILAGSQHWGMSQAVFDRLYAAGVRLEGFGSPVNTRTLHTDANFCSVFLDTDEPFGSVGNFFDVPLHEHSSVAINPPFIETIMEAMAVRCNESLKMCETAGTDQTIYVYLPAWDDSVGVQLVKDSKFAKIVKKFNRNELYLEDQEGKMFKARFESYFVVLATGGVGLETLKRTMNDVVKIGKSGK